MFGNYFYNESMRRMLLVLVKFLITYKLKRKDDTEKLCQTIKVPLAYAPKEKFLVRLDQQSRLK